MQQKKLQLSQELSDTLSLGFPEKMVLLDCETTGGKADYHRITELGLVVVEKGQVVEQWTTLIDPERSIPAPITQLTGISDEMVASAPLFSQIADQLLEKLQNRIFVAHNARFDYSFIKNEFHRLGISFTTKPLCSVRLSRKLFPQFKRHSLDHLIQRFSIPMSDRHRGLDDALAIWHFFRHCSVIHDQDEIQAACNRLLKTASLPSNLDRSEIEKLPDLPGVYRFYDHRDTLLYIGKSVSLRTRVMSHFSGDHSNAKDLKINSRLTHIDFDRTPSDFGAQLLESQQVKLLAPIYNRRLRRVKHLYQFVLKSNEAGYLLVSIQPVSLNGSSGKSKLGKGLYRSRFQAKRQLEKLADDFLLCHQFLGLEPRSKNGCFRVQLKKCRGACCNKESVANYNIRVQAALANSIVAKWPWRGPILVQERCSIDQEFAQYHLVDDWVYKGKVDSLHALNDIYSSVTNISQENICEDSVSSYNDPNIINVDKFDMDNYYILLRFLSKPKLLKQHNIRIIDLSKESACFREYPDTL